MILWVVDCCPWYQVDVLKIDIEGSEFETFHAVQEVRYIVNANQMCWP